MPDMTLDDFDKAREGIWRLPGFQQTSSTILAPGSLFFPAGTWVVETIITNDQQAIFLQFIGAAGSKRIVVPDKVAKAIHRQYQELTKRRRKAAAKAGAETRQKRQAPKEE